MEDSVHYLILERLCDCIVALDLDIPICIVSERDKGTKKT